MAERALSNTRVAIAGSIWLLWFTRFAFYDYTESWGITLHFLGLVAGAFIIVTGAAPTPAPTPAAAEGSEP